MFQIFLQSLAQAALERLFERNRGQYNRIEKAIDELSKRGFQASNIKKLAGTKNIFRKRVGRWRVLFTIHSAAPSSNGSGHYPLTVVIGVRLPLGSPFQLQKAKCF